MKFLKEYAGVIGLASLALILSWNQPLLSSHSFRQVQTAQNAQIFLKEGWTPFLTKVRFLGDPGIMVLEFPVYQSLMAGLTRATSLPLENTGRILSLLSGLALALACATALREIKSFLDIDTASLPFSAVALIVFCSPLVFATSQWVTLELMNASLAAWAFVFFLWAWKTHKPIQKALWMTGYGLCAVTSIVMKPHGLFVLMPLFGWRICIEACAVKRDENKRKGFIQTILLSALVTTAIFVMAAIWYRYADRVNAHFHSPYSVFASGTRLMFGEQQLWKIHVLTRLIGRFALYVLGPGTIAFFGFLAFQRPGSFRDLLPESKRFIFAGVCFFSILLYLSLFTGANYYHNYYQVASVFPIYLGLFSLVNWPSNRWSLVLAACICVNLVLSNRYLTRQDPYWKEMLANLQTQVPPGYDRPPITIYSNWGASAPVLSYYLERRTLDKPFVSLKKDDVNRGESLGLCDNREETACRDILKHLYAKEPSKVFGPLSLFKQN